MIINFQNRKAVKVVKWKVEVGQIVYDGRVLLLYEEEDGKVSKLKSKHVGTLKNLIAKEGETISPGEPLLELEAGCSHPTVINDLCAECGADLQKDGVTESNATVPMVHSIPQLKVSQKQAEELGRADTERLLKNRKLVLLVDLDQTLIHTTHDNIPNNLKDVHHFQLGGPAWYHTRLRPGTTRFLKEMNEIFELHICTFGVRPYAHTVARILDKDGTLFANRILSRDECLHHNSKVANLQALFPCGDEMVCIIDDREDVWNYSPNLIPVKPYNFFTNTGDINDPNLPPIAKHSDFFAKGIKVKAKESSEVNDGENEILDVEDEDDYLLYLESILKNVHKTFYDIYDKKLEGKAEVRWVLKHLRGDVLKDCEIVFSGLIPLREGLEQSEPYLIASNLGGKIVPDITPTTTHVVAAAEGTMKVRSARKMSNVYVVNPHWLTTCLYRWEKVEERLYPLESGIQMNRKPPAISLTLDDMVSMKQEVMAEFKDSEDEDESDDSLGMSDEEAPKDDVTKNEEAEVKNEPVEKNGSETLVNGKEDPKSNVSPLDLPLPSFVAEETPTVSEDPAPSTSSQKTPFLKSFTIPKRQRPEDPQQVSNNVTQKDNPSAEPLKKKRKGKKVVWKQNLVETVLIEPKPSVHLDSIEVSTKTKEKMRLSQLSRRKEQIQGVQLSNIESEEKRSREEHELRMRQLREEFRTKMNKLEEVMNMKRQRHALKVDLLKMEFEKKKLELEAASAAYK